MTDAEELALLLQGPQRELALVRAIIREFDAVLLTPLRGIHVYALIHNHKEGTHANAVAAPAPAPGLRR